MSLKTNVLHQHLLRQGSDWRTPTDSTDSTDTTTDTTDTKYQKILAVAEAKYQKIVQEEEAKHSAAATPLPFRSRRRPSTSLWRRISATLTGKRQDSKPGLVPQLRVSRHALGRRASIPYAHVRSLTPCEVQLLAVRWGVVAVPHMRRVDLRAETVRGRPR